MREIVKARLDFVIFENKENHYVVASFEETEDYHEFTGAGRLVDPKEEGEYELEGEYVEHPRYGTQFRIDRAKLVLPTRKEAVVHFLSSDTFPTIGKKSAETIYDTLGEDCLEQIRQNPQVLQQVPRFPQKKIDIITDGICQFTGFNDNYIKLLEYGLTNRQITLLENTYEDDALKTIEEDPFRPLYEIYGFGYKGACRLADAIELPADDLRRLEAMIYEECRQMAMRSGNTYIPYPIVQERFQSVQKEAFEQALANLIGRQNLQAEQEKIYPFSLYEDEILIAKGLRTHWFDVEPVAAQDIDEKIEQVEFMLNIEYDTIQKQAIHAFFEHSATILNGGPGTGKTTTVKGILQIARMVYPDAVIQLCAPTGRASKRLSQLSDNDSKTIHSLLKWNLDDNQFGKDENDPLDVDILIVDEFSMVDTHLFAALLRALPPYCRILLIGDEDQLESVGPGKVFNDLIESGIYPIVHLEKIFRQSSGSGIAQLARLIRDEQPLAFADGASFIERGQGQILETLKKAIAQYDEQERMSLQIIAPMYKGKVGIDAINATMQAMINPNDGKKRQVKAGTVWFREDDKVMLLKNLPEDDVYNGDIGYISEIHDGVITVDFGSQIVDFSKDFLYYLSHAYCISVHKAQGSEYDRVYCVVEPQTAHMLNKRLLYTAVSRAKKELFVVGDPALFGQRVRRKQSHIRMTTLQQRIQEVMK